MPAYLVELPSSLGQHLLAGADKAVVFANDVANARAAAGTIFGEDGSGVWATLATVTEIVIGTQAEMEGYEALCRVSGAAGQTSDVYALAKGAKTNVQTAAVNSGGVATYAINDILTIVGGTAIRAATCRVITVSVGVVTAVELVDPGHYTEVPATLTGLATTGGGGSGCTVDVTISKAGSYEACLGELITLLNQHVDIATAAVDFSSGAAGARLITVAAAGDSLGDGTVVFEMRKNGTAVPALVSTITDGGVAGAALSVAIPASPMNIPRVTPVKGV